MPNDTDPAIPLRALKAMGWLVVYVGIGTFAWLLLTALERIAEGVR